jgi:hypothetical protein
MKAIDNRFSSALHQIKSSAIPSQKGADGTHHGSVRPCLFGLLLISSASATSNWTRIDVSGIPDDRPVFLLVASSVQTSFNLNQRPVFESHTTTRRGVDASSTPGRVVSP